METISNRHVGGSGGARAESIASLKASLDLVELAGKHGVALKRSGRSLWGSCCFHPDKTPSLQIDPERQTFRCFGCGKRGDAIDFLVAKEGVDLARQSPPERAGTDPGT
jgi:DNA primase